MVTAVCFLTTWKQQNKPKIDKKKQIKDIVNMFANNYNASSFELWIWLP